MPIGDRLRVSVVDSDDCTLFLTVNADGSINVTSVGGVTAMTQNLNTNRTVNAGNVLALAANANRVGFYLFNYGDANLHVNFAAAAATTDDQVLPPNVGITQPEPGGYVYQGAINVIQAAAPTTVPNLSVVEWT